MKAFVLAFTAFALIALFWGVVLLGVTTDTFPRSNFGDVSLWEVFKTFVTVLPALATLTVGIVAGIIAFQQWRLAADKLKLDLFDRRYKVYEAIKEFVYICTHQQDFEDSVVFKFKQGTADLGFLFGPEVRDYRDEVRRRVMDVRKMAMTMRRRQFEIHQSKVDVYYDELEWVSNQITESEKVFLPYLGFRNVSVLKK
jgi:hypothetical protein